MEDEAEKRVNQYNQAPSDVLDLSELNMNFTTALKQLS